MDNTRKKQIINGDISRNLPLTDKQYPQNDSDPNKSFINGMAAKNFEKYEVIVDNEQLQKEMRLIEWRSKTELPLVKILFYKILQKKLLNECSVVQVAIQNFTHNLYTLPKMGFYQILYLLKEALIGFQRLYDRFGSFEPTHKMILINKNNKCRVWINENITLNFPGKRSNISENQLLIKILKLFEEKCTRSILVIDLFQKMAGMEKVVHAMQYMQSYMRGNRIVLPSRLVINTQPSITNSPKLSKTPTKVKQGLQDVFNKLKNQSFGGSQVKKIPKFILNLREQRKFQTSIDQKTNGDISKGKNQLKRNYSQLKIINKSLSRREPLKQNNISQQKSSNSPISNISQTSKKDKSSNGQILSRTSLRNLIRQGSQQYLNPFMAMTSRKIIEPLQRLQKRPSLKQQEQLPKLQLESQTLLRVPLEDYQRHLVTSAKDLYSINCSQQTATTINQSSINQKELKSPIIKEQPQSLAEPQQASIFEKNGWMRRVNNLTEDEFCREMAQSQHEGTEIFSQQYSLASEKLVLLGTMGKVIKGSVISEL